MTDHIPSPEAPESLPSETEVTSSKRRRRRKRTKSASPNSVNAVRHPKAYQPLNEIRHPENSPRAYLRHTYKDLEKERQRSHKSALHWTPRGDGHVYRQGEGVWSYRFRRPGSDEPTSELPSTARGHENDSTSATVPRNRRHKRRSAEVRKHPHRRKKGNEAPQAPSAGDIVPEEDS